MHWNHRVVRTTHPSGEKTFAIHEVYYEGKKVTGRTADPIPVVSYSKKELRQTLERMLACLDKPALKIKEGKDD